MIHKCQFMGETVRKMVSAPIFFFYYYYYYYYYYFSRLSKQTRKQNFCNLLHTNKVFTEQEEKWISLSKAYKTLGVYKKPMAVNKWLSIHNFTQKKFILSFYCLFYFIIIIFYLFIYFFNCYRQQAQFRTVGCWN